MQEILLSTLPKVHGPVKGCWFQGYPIHKGFTEASLNYATVYAKQKRIIPNQATLKKDFEFYKKTLRQAGFKVHSVPFPKELNQIDNLRHDAVFIRDVGFMYKNMWIKSNFSCRHRQPEADAYAPIIAKKFRKKIVNLPKGAYLEFGDVSYLNTQDGVFYFGGLSRSNKKGHDFVKKIIKPDHYCLIKSEGYHLDTIFAPVINKENQIAAFLVNKRRLDSKCLNKIKQLGFPLINIKPADSSGVPNKLGNYAVNALVAPGVMISCHKFETPGVEKKLKERGIKHYITPLTYFRYAGGSCHCLANEVNK